MSNTMKTWIGLAFMLSACNVVTEADLEEVLGQYDSGTVEVDASMDAEVEDVGTDTGGDEDSGEMDAEPEVDAGPEPWPGNSCGDSEAMLLSGENTITFDTRANTSSRGSFSVGDCRLIGALGGNDVFFELEIGSGGEYWHFHLSADPSNGVEGVTERDPKIFLLPGNCNEMACRSTYFSDSCTGTGDEHFGFEFPSGGTWYLGIDDANPGGGIYRLDAYRPLCMDETTVHGEPCDPTDPAEMRPCTDRCRLMVGEEGGITKLGGPINSTEANQVVFDGSFAPVEINSFVGGPVGTGFCDYPDYFAIEVPSQGAALKVGLSQGCVMGANQIGLQLINSAQAVIMDGGGGACPEIDVPASDPLDEGLYFVRVTDNRIDDSKDTTITFTLRFELTPQ